MVAMLLGAFVVAVMFSVIACAVALKLFPWFASGERKEGNFKADQSTGSYHIEAGAKGKGVHVRRGSPSTSELPLIGGVAMLVAVILASVGIGIAIGLTGMDWVLLAILLSAAIGFGLVGLVDDWRKVHYGSGISEIQKAIGMLVVSLAAAIALNRLIVTGRLSARFVYPPYSDVPLLGTVLHDVHFAWIIFFLLMTMTVASSTSLAVDFSDGMDGLCGGLLIGASLAFAVILLNYSGTDHRPLALVSLAIAGAAFGYLPFNWPSPWRGPHSPGKRRARLIMGDTGALALGGLLALVAVISRLEPLLLIIGGVFVLEGLSALISARILVKFFRHFLVLERFRDADTFPHTEFPLPFLATPMHHHFDLLGWDRKRLVYGAWLYGAVLAVLGVASVLCPYSWERYLARFAGFIVILIGWQMGPWTRYFFVGLAHRRGDHPNTPRNLGLFYGYPFKLFGRRLFHCVDMTSVTEHTISALTEELSLWQRMNVFDARALLGYYCYREDAVRDAVRVWDRIPLPNLNLRPEVQEKLAELRHRIALEDEEAAAGARVTAAQTTLAADSWLNSPAPKPDDPGASQWRLAVPSSGLTQPSRLVPAEPPLAAEAPTTPQMPAPLWNAATYTHWASGVGEPRPADAQGSTPDQQVPDELETALANDQPTVPVRQHTDVAADASDARHPHPTFG